MLKYINLYTKVLQREGLIGVVLTISFENKALRVTVLTVLDFHI